MLLTVILGYTAGGAAGGTVAGGMGAGFNGGDIGQGMLTGMGLGAVGGAAFGGIGGHFGKTWNLYRVGAYTLAGGGVSELAGGDFGTGAMFAGGMTLCAYGYYKLTDIANGGRVPKGELSDGTAIQKTGDPETDMRLMDANRNKSWFGSAGETLKELNSRGHEGWSKFRWLTSHVPFANDIAYVHDFGWGRIFGNAGWNVITNYGSMLPAAVLTLSGAAAYYSPLTSGLMFGIREE